ncbi:MAG: creatininase family protein [Treponema sp.]|jgi:creatinine amidohydrolase|nr:creatininase family protein [Treponema sp.]
MRWELLTPPDFKKLAREEQVCIVPLGSLERHGDHLPLGTDSLIAHRVACEAAEQEKCVVFPPYWFGQLHEASCFTGSIVLSSKLTLQVFEELLDEIGRNGFTKILVLNAHGGNNGMLDYLAWSTVEKETPYTLYLIRMLGPDWGERTRKCAERLKTAPIGHACEYETSMMQAITPEAVRMEYQTLAEPILPLKRLEHLPGIYSGLSWFADYPNQVIGCPSAGSRETGEAFIKAMAVDLAESLKKIKDDTSMALLKKEFLEKRRSVEQGS